MVTLAARRDDLRQRYAPWVERTLHGWLDHCAQQWPDRPFVITDRCTLTYAEVAEESRRLADGLAVIGTRPGDRVGIVMANYAEFVPLKFAVSRLGATAVPFNFRYRKDEFGYVLAQSRCRTLVTMTAHAGIDHLAALDALVPGWHLPEFADRPLVGDGVAPDALRRVVVFADAGEAPAGALTLPDVAELGASNVGSAGPKTADPGDVADILYTSGSTGLPKGVMVTHDAVLRTGFASALTRAYEDGRRILFSLPCYHMFGYVEGLISAMYVGGAVVMQTSFDAADTFAAIERHRVNDLLCVPTMAVAMVESPARHQHDLSSLTAILCGSAPAPVWLWEKVEADLGVSEIVTGYGMTECGGCMTLTLPEDELARTSTTVGRPKLAGAAGLASGDLCRYAAVDPHSGALLPPGEVGELVSAGPTTMLGYFDKPEETSAALRLVGDQVLLHSGDLGRVRSDGYLELTGRTKELYKSGGELVMPKEVEDVLARHEQVSQVFAIGLQDDRWGEIGCAVVVPVAGANLTERELIAFAAERLAGFKVPKRVVFLEAARLPTTATGKVQKFRLVDLVNELPEGQLS